MAKVYVVTPTGPVCHIQASATLKLTLCGREFVRLATARDANKRVCVRCLDSLRKSVVRGVEEY